MPTANQRRRRRPGVGTAVTAAIVAYGTYQLANWAWNRWVANEEDEVQQQQQNTSSSSNRANVSSPPKTPQQKRQLHRLRKERITKCRQDVVNALEGFLPTVRRVIDEATNVSQDKQALKELRLRSRLKSRHKIKQEEGHAEKIHDREQEEAALWTNIQVNTLTRMIATAYAHTILFVVLTVQVHLLGGHLFRRLAGDNSVSPNSVAVAADGEEEDADTVASHRTVLTETYHNFLDTGLMSLLDTIREAVKDTVSSSPEWNVLDPATALHMTRDTFQAAMDRIRSLVEVSSSQNILRRIIVPPSVNGSKNAMTTTRPAIDDGVALFLLAETWDLLESPVVDDALKECLDGTFDMMRRQHWDAIFAAGGEDRPLAQVIAQLKHTTQSFYYRKEGDVGSTPYCSMMESLPSVVELSDVSFN